MLIKNSRNLLRQQLREQHQQQQRSFALSFMISRVIPRAGVILTAPCPRTARNAHKSNEIYHACDVGHKREALSARARMNLMKFQRTKLLKLGFARRVLPCLCIECFPSLSLAVCRSKWPVDEGASGRGQRLSRGLNSRWGLDRQPPPRRRGMSSPRSALCKKCSRLC
jgi:hypothetical protein